MEARDQLDQPMPTSPVGGPATGGLARWRAPLVAATMVAALFATIFLAALGEPRPHEVAVVVVGDRALASAVQDGLDGVAPGAFEVDAVGSGREADSRLLARDAFGVLDPTTAPVQVRIAAFNGAALNGAVQGALVAAAAAGPGEATPEVVDLQAGEGKPASIFYVVFGMVIAAMAFTVASGTLTPFATRGGLRPRLLATVVTALVVGVAVSLVAWAFDALPGGYVAVAGLAALLMCALALCVQGLALLLGPAGLVVSAIFFIMVGNAASGAAVHVLLLGDGWRQASPLLPTGAGATAIVDVAAFEDASIAAPVAVLVGWVVIGLVLLALGFRRRDAAATPAPAA